MMMQDSRLPCRTVYVGVYLGCQYAFMPEHLLHNPQVGPILYKMGCKGMPECMWGNLFVDTCKHCIMLDHIEYRHPAEP